jgi:hypothetical protein
VVEVEGGTDTKEQADVWGVVGLVLLLACVLSLVGSVSQALRFLSFPFEHSTHLKIQAAARAVSLFSAVLLLAAALALRSVRRFSTCDRIAYRAAGVLGALIAIIALYSAVDAQNSIHGQHGIPALDRLTDAAGGFGAALVGATVVWLVFRSHRSHGQPSPDAP